MEIISFINMKGGVGKTTSVVELGTILASEHDKKVLIIDIDPQTNSTFSLIGLEQWGEVKDTATIADVLGMNKGLSSRDEEYNINNAIISNVCGIENLDLIPSHIELTFLDIDLSSEPGRENILSRQIEKLETEYDLVLIDCPPNLTIAPQNALVVSNYIIVPVSPEFYAAIGLPLLISRVNQLKRKLPGCTVEILGILFTQVRNTKDHTHHLDSIRRTCSGELDVHTFQTIIPFTTKISEAAKYNKPSTIINPNENGILAYKNFAEELILTLEN